MGAFYPELEVLEFVKTYFDSVFLFFFFINFLVNSASSYENIEETLVPQICTNITPLKHLPSQCIIRFKDIKKLVSCTILFVTFSDYTLVCEDLFGAEAFKHRIVGETTIRRISY